MKTNEEALKKIVQKKYALIAEQPKSFNQASCCGAGNTSNKVYNIMMDDYTKVEGYVDDADLGLGCGLPTQFAKIMPGDTVLDLGSGAGNDCFVARHETGETGKVIGIDFTDVMIEKARFNADKLGFNNVEFRFGDIDNLPVSSETIDVVVSNCVLNLVPDKPKVFSEMYRVLKPGGHFSVSDIVLVGDLPKALREDAEMYAGCVAGAIQKDTYLKYLQDAGFREISIQKEKTISLPDDILDKYLNPKELEAFQKREHGIFSITVFGKKAGLTDKQKINISEISKTKCAPNSGCC
ncbi:MAG: arsenite S-adenosylmethyltransferase [Bacteroidetes bacterium HGW-Bacteroidetes-13]|nr:MAG: arsenite S-adenosylmethyltransferase [Bacteroidetes bacterium HGW-Bacteroidetes-13]